MSGIYYVLSIVGVFIVIRWVIRNDRVDPDGATEGLLGLKNHESSRER
jgi:hypothetical protein